MKLAEGALAKERSSDSVELQSSIALQDVSTLIADQNVWRVMAYLHVAVIKNNFARASPSIMGRVER